MKKVLVVFGTRPEAIKLAPVVHELKKQSSSFQTLICVTAQHRQMLDQVLNLFQITPDYDLNIMSFNQDLFDITGKTLLGLRDVFQKENPDLVIVQGDTTTAFVAGLAAYYLKIKIAHVEAGLRTYNKYHPFPEEKNRHMVTALADYHFAPTPWAKDNLLQEHIEESQIWVTGNTVIDALIHISEKITDVSEEKKWNQYFWNEWQLDLSSQDQKKKMILVTGHRRENFGAGFQSICRALGEIALNNKEVNIVYPVHLNPNVRTPVLDMFQKSGKMYDNVFLLEPLEYEPFVYLMNKSYLILTDSGGVQEEAPSLGKPVLVMRNTTERPEGIQAGIVKLVGTDENKIVQETQKLLNDPKTYQAMSQPTNPYGDGRAAERIVQILRDGKSSEENPQNLHGLADRQPYAGMV